MTAAPTGSAAPATTDVHGPIDFVLIEFAHSHLAGRAADEVVALVDRGVIRLYDVLVVGRREDGSVYSADLAEVSPADAGGFEALGYARSGLLGDDDVAEAATALEPDSMAVLLVYENLWAVPFVAAAREAGGEMVAAGRIPAQDVMAALDDLESADPSSPTATPQS